MWPSFKPWPASATTPPPPTDAAGLARREQAVALYKAPFLEGFSLPDAAPFEEWALLQREWLQRLALETLRHLVAGWQERAEPTRALGHAWRLVELEPWDEDAHRQIMELLVACGRPGEALAQYERCRQILRRELDAEPQPETSALYASIQQGQTENGASAPSVPEAVSSALPPQTTPLIGRETELAQIARRLADPGCRLLTIVGPGGIGKTRLAIQAAQEQTDHFAHGVHFIDLAPVSAADRLPATILYTLQASHNGALNPQRRLLTFVRDKEMLLLLDNCEHLLAGVGLLAQMLHAAPGLKLLVTSRERLNLHDEWLFPLEGLAVPPGLDRARVGPILDDARQSQPPPTPASGAENYSAIRLFLHCVRRLRLGFRPTPEEVAHIVHICQVLEGMPLAIQLAAAWIRTLSCAQIAQEMAGSLAFLATPLRDVPDRHRSMHAAFDHSWRLLSKREQSLLRQLAVFRGGFTHEAATAVAGASLADLAGLVDASWLRATPSGRYGMHELVRQYCEEKLERDQLAVDGEDGRRVRDRHSAYYGVFLHSQEQGYNWQRQAMATITPESGNVMAAWNWAVASGDVDRINQMSISLYFIAEMEGWYITMLELFDAAMDRLNCQLETTADDPDDSRGLRYLLTTLLYIQGQLYAHLGLLERAEGCVDRGLAVLQAARLNQRDEERRIWLRHLQARVLSLQGDSAGAIRLLEELLTYMQETDIPFWPHVPEIGTRFMQAHFYGALGQEAWVGGDYAAAERLLRQALALRKEIGERRFRAFNLVWLARVMQTTGDYAQAEELARESLRLSQAFGDQIGTANAYLALGRVETALGRYILARAHCEQSLDITRRTGYHSVLIGSLVELGHIELALGRTAAAKRLFEEAGAVFAELETAHSNYVAAATLGLGRTALAMQDIPLAKKKFQEVLNAASRAAWETLDAIEGVAQALQREGRLERATELLTLVVETPATAHATRETAAATLRELETALSPARFATATAQGRQRRVEDGVAELAG